MKRRSFLKLGAAAGALGIASASGIGALSRSSAEDSSYEISTENGNYVFIGGVHGGPSAQQLLLPEGVKRWDGFFLEYNSLSTNLYEEESKNFLEKIQRTPFYEKIAPFLVQAKVPLLLGDMPIPPWYNDLYYSVGQSAVNVGEAAIGSAMAIGKGNEYINRREFLKSGLGAVVGAWGFWKLGKDFSAQFPGLLRQPWAEELRKVASVGEFLHPEDMIVNARNALIAKKLLYYSREFKAHHDGEKPTIGIAMGAGHEFISEYLKGGEKFCMDAINRYPESVLKKFFGEGNYKEYFPILFQITSEKALKMIDPELQKKVGNLEKDSHITSSESKG